MRKSIFLAASAALILTSSSTSLFAMGGYGGGGGMMDAQSPAGKIILNAVEKYPEKIWLRIAIVAGTFREQPLGQPPIIEPRSETRIFKKSRDIATRWLRENRSGVRPSAWRPPGSLRDAGRTAGSPRASGWSR